MVQSEVISPEFDFFEGLTSQEFIIVEEYNSKIVLPSKSYLGHASQFPQHSLPDKASILVLLPGGLLCTQTHTKKKRL